MLFAWKNQNYTDYILLDPKYVDGKIYFFYIKKYLNVAKVFSNKKNKVENDLYDLVDLTSFKIN
jgi:hypothetical protein